MVELVDRRPDTTPVLTDAVVEKVRNLKHGKGGAHVTCLASTVLASTLPTGHPVESLVQSGSTWD
jgi:hypothetical protein